MRVQQNAKNVTLYIRFEAFKPYLRQLTLHNFTRCMRFRSDDASSGVDTKATQKRF